MAGVPKPERANQSVGCYGKGQSILVDKIEEKQKLGKSKNKIVRKGKATKKLVNKLSKTARRKKRGFTEGSATAISREDRSNSRSTCKKNVTQKNPTLLQKLKELAAEVDGY